MRKAWASFILFLVFCCSLSAAGAENMAIAVEGVYDGVVSAMASYLAVPRVALQGVTVVSGKGLIPSRISFVRSDVSTYADSLSFFSGDVSFSSDDGTPESLPMKVVSDRVVERLRREGFSAGEVILDGSVRVVETPELDALSLLEDDDWSDCIYVRCSLSMLVLISSMTARAMLLRLIYGTREKVSSSHCWLCIPSAHTPAHTAERSAERVNISCHRL